MLRCSGSAHVPLSINDVIVIVLRIVFVNPSIIFIVDRFYTGDARRARDDFRERYASVARLE